MVLEFLEFDDDCWLEGLVKIYPRNNPLYRHVSRGDRELYKRDPFIERFSEYGIYLVRRTAASSSQENYEFVAGKYARKDLVKRFKSLDRLLLRCSEILPLLQKLELGLFDNETIAPWDPELDEEWGDHTWFRRYEAGHFVGNRFLVVALFYDIQDLEQKGYFSKGELRLLKLRDMEKRKHIDLKSV